MKNKQTKKEKKKTSVIYVSPHTSRLRQRSELKVDRGGLVLGRFAGNLSKQIGSGGHASNFRRSVNLSINRTNRSDQ